MAIAWRHPGNVNFAPRTGARLGGGFFDPDFGAVTCRGKHTDKYVGGDAMGVAVRNRRDPPTQDACFGEVSPKT